MENEKDVYRQMNVLDELKRRLETLKEWRESQMNDFEKNQKEFYEIQKINSERIEDLEDTIKKLS